MGITTIPGDKKKGADKGIDGRLWIGDGAEVLPVVISVKGGRNVGVSMVRDLRGVVQREKAAVGVLITLVDPTQPMRAEAADAGLFESRGIGGMKVPRLQILTIEQLLNGGRIQLPPQTQLRSTRQAPRARRAGKADPALSKRSRSGSREHPAPAPLPSFIRAKAIPLRRRAVARPRPAG